VCHFEGKVGLITGGSAGMGLTTARLLAEDGAHVIILGRDRRKLETSMKEIEPFGSVSIAQADIGDLRQLDDTFAGIEQRFGRIDLLFANAGLGLFKPFIEWTEEDFDYLSNINFKGTFFTVQKALALMPDGAAIVINASWTYYRGLVGSSLYSATKAAVSYLAKVLAAELADRGIRVNSVSPGYINTEQFNEDDLPQDMVREMKSQVASGRFGTPAEVAGVVRFLLSDEASYVNGQDWVIDSGLTSMHRVP
jgi:NAD(P)-dependent dehydrogenase (short-subunit alcohol dehydrogenase family)